MRFVRRPASTKGSDQNLRIELEKSRIQKHRTLSSQLFYRKTKMPLSKHPAIKYVSTLFSTIFVGFGLTYVLYPRTGYSLYGFSNEPTSAHDWAVVERVMILYGVKDLFIAAAIFASTWFGTTKSAGTILIAGGACAGADGWVVRGEAGTGECNHWGYGSAMVGLGAVMMGLMG
jgi:hypothetical protein